jgi:peptidoglycan/LPS O-acetylase OafA/YrhL
MISGFVILMSASKGGPLSFIASRFVRLYPAYWTCVSLTFIFLIVWHWPTLDRPTIADFLLNLTMLQEAFGVAHIDGVYWTLVVELHFYALVLLVLWSGQVVNIDRILSIWLLAGIAADFVPAVRQVGDLFVAQWCHYFIAGALAYRMRIFGCSVPRLILFGLAYVQAARHAHWFVDLKQRLTQVNYEPWVVQIAIFTMFVFFLLISLGRLQVKHSSLRTWGALTYPLYLIHGAIGSTLLIAWVREHDGNRWVAVCVITGASIAAAWFIQRKVEGPFSSQLRRRFMPWIAGRQFNA